MLPKLLHWLFALVLCFTSTFTTAQRFIGFSVNYGDHLTYTPHYHGLLLNRNSFSPTIVYHYEKKFLSDFTLLFGGQTGIAGYQVVAIGRDTISGNNDRNGFADYGILVTRLEVTPGKVFRIGTKTLFVGIGGGVSYYRFFFEGSGYGIQIIHDSKFEQTFNANIDASASGTLSPFAKVYLKMPISPRLDIAFQYSRHFTSVAQGEFEFYHTKEPASGTIKLVPQGISFMLLYRLRGIGDANKLR